MKITIIACDAGPSNALDAVGDVLSSKGYTTRRILGFGQLIEMEKMDLAEMVYTSDVVLLGMSSHLDRAGLEIFAAEVAAEESIPYGFFANQFKVVRRRGFESVGRGAAFACVIAQSEVNSPGSVFRPEVVRVTGSPAFESFFRRERASSHELHAQLGVEEGTPLILCGGTKFILVTAPMFAQLVEACSMLSPQPHIFLGGHPSEGFKEYARELNQLGVVGVTVLANVELRAGDVIHICDAVVTSSTTTGTEGAILGKPILFFNGFFSKQEMISSTGDEIWPPCQNGAHLEGPITLHSITQLLYSQSAEVRGMKAAQELMFPPPSRDAPSASSRIADIVLQHAR